MRSRIVRAGSRLTKQAAASSFTGIVWKMRCSPRTALARARHARDFHARRRTNWHTNAAGQILYVLAGVGRHQIEGEAVQALLPGDTVVISLQARDWHGAAPDHMMTHLAISETSAAGEATTWLDR